MRNCCPKAILLSGLNNGCMFLLVINHVFMYLVTHASIHKTHAVLLSGLNNGCMFLLVINHDQKLPKPTPPCKVFYFYAQRAFT